MIFSALLSFFGGTAFRMIWGEVSSWLNKKQDHDHEMARMTLQGELDAAQHGRNLEALRLQADLKVQVIQAQAEAKVDELTAEAWGKLVEGTTKTIGIAWIDGWNAVIRPAVATWAVVMMTLSEFAVITAMSDNSWMVASAALGIYLADRTLFKRGK